ncbi:hypothetical protein CDD82_4776 [Ophiocordyceps australis]|uniref:ATP-dependent DNA ligase family profile domain-containing protein n=1 Tax=Ophiocordyceps australis TaxID=1399860 RepID=A0A2C5ZP03_9HYPO|nr:hypothetical protein CDD82_4776 [Ophiocordyceps australis]
MPFPFALVCNLLDECYSLCLAGKPVAKAVVSWFDNYRHLIDAHDTCLASLLSTLLPEKRPDRVYSIQTSRLVNIVARALIPGSSRIAELTRFKLPGSGVDLADCVESILMATPNTLHSKGSRVTIEDIDQILNAVASSVRWSSPAIRRRSSSFMSSDHATLEATYRKLTAREAKWFTRLILKDYQPLALDCHLVYRCCHPLLPLLLKFQDDFVSALKILQDAKSAAYPDSEGNQALRTRILDSLKPRIGVKVARQNWLKARSIKNCIDLGHGRMSVETKMDGEYCQIHVDAAHNPPRIQIFSKSGKDSTEDRVGLHDTIAQSLNLDLPDCKIRKHCILEGELVVYSDKENKILPFHKIRNHVSRRGLFLNIEQDSPPQDCEHLMIVYFDILLLNDDSLLATRHSERFKILERIVSQRRGWSELISRQIIDFQSRHASSDLRNAFANIIVAKDEGLVLKPDEPYFNLQGSNRSLAGCCIKLKKEYIGNFGDVGDFAVVGAGFNAAKAKSYNIPNVKWTHFFIGCITNREEAKNPQVNPEFTVINVVELNKTQIGALVKFGTPLPLPVLENRATKVQIPRGIDTSAPMTVVFQNPPVFDLRCFSFDKPGNMGFWTLRFPVVSKIHFDRDYTDTISFDELQQMAKKATTIPEVEDSQENLAWVAKLESADPMDSNFDAVSQMTTTTISTLSDSNSTQSTGP